MEERPWSCLAREEDEGEAEDNDDVEVEEVGMFESLHSTCRPSIGPVTAAAKVVLSRFVLVDWQ